jgi:putative ATP-dependent endonuclease of OLD family
MAGDERKWEMKLRRVLVENVRSFLEPAELHLEQPISILIGPNGGGKTNLLDTITTVLRKYLVSSVAPRRSPTAQEPERYEFVANDMLQNTILEPHTQGKGLQQVVEIEVEVTNSDIENMTSMKAYAKELSDQTERKYVGASIREAGEWDLSTLQQGQRFVYSVVNNQLKIPKLEGAQIFHRYLTLYEIDSWLRGALGMASLSTPMLSMPINRASGGIQSSVNLAGYNEFDVKRAVDAASSRISASTMSLAVGRIATKYRLLEIKDNGRAKSDFREDPAIQSLTQVLAFLGYSWDLVCTDPMNNSYDIQLEKQGSKFLVGHASSGEKELFTHLFAIYALNVRDALIIIDEPELHLHPRWQASLLSLFERLSVETGNQFLLATHSPVFVSPSSIQYVSRVYSDQQRSAIVRMQSSHLPEPRHLFSIVNSQNNERMFFADKVVLVEGISDRVFFDAVFQHLGVTALTTRACEIISVGGKGFFKPYEAILKACKVPYAVIADLDYLDQIGTSEIKGLFSLNEQEIKRKVIYDPASKDGEALVARMEDAISGGSIEDLRSLWGYIKSRRRRLPSDLNDAERKLIDDFISLKREENVMVLSKGTLESYLPEGYRSKDVDKLIHFVSRGFWSQLPEFAKEELSTIGQRVKSL